MFTFYLISLILSVITINYYISSGIRVGIHRLLPMTTVAIALHDICQLGILFYSEDKLFLIFDDMLMLQILYLLTHYIREFYYIKFKKRTEIMLVSSIIVMVGIVVLQERYPMLYRVAYGLYSIVYLIGLMIASTKIMKMNYFSKMERKVVHLLYLATMSSCITLLFRKAPFVNGTLMSSIRRRVHRSYLSDLFRKADR